MIYRKLESRREPPPAPPGDLWGGPLAGAPGAAAAVDLGGGAVAVGGWSPPPPPPPAPSAGVDPYRPPSAAVGVVEIDSGLPLADRGNRFFAQVLDGLVGAGVWLLFLLSIPITATAGEDAGILAGTVLIVVGFGVLVAVNLRLLHLHGQTIGKRALGIRIVRTDGDRAGLGRILVLRMIVPGLIGAIPYLGILFAVVDPLFIFRDDRRCLHDHLADTKVVVA